MEYNWILTEDKIPETSLLPKSRWVLIMYYRKLRSCGQIDIACFDKKNNSWRDRNWRELTINQVTHWCKLPSKTKKGIKK